MQTSFQKSIAGEIAAIDRLLAKTESAVKRAFLEYLKNAKSEETLKTVRRFLEQGNVEGVIQHFERLALGLSRPITDAMIVAAIEETSVLAPKAVAAVLRQNGIRVPQIAFQFDPANPQAAEVMRANGARLVQQINENQRTVIRHVVSEAQMSGDGPLATARKIRDTVGLTESQRQAVNNYARLLREGNAQALDRGLRDRRSDPTVDRNSWTYDRKTKEWVAPEKPLTNDQIDKMVSSYQNRYISYRADVIARTEAHTAVNLARQEALNQTLDQAGIPQQTVKRRWMATKDKRTRDTHAAMGYEKQTVGLNQPFISPSGAQIMYPGDASAPAAERIQCRCTTITLFE